MKHNKKMAGLILVLGLGLLGANGLQAGWVETTKGQRYALPRHGEQLSTTRDFQNLREGDKVSFRCPMMNETQVTTIRNVDTKGHAKLRETKRGLKVDGCNIVLQRKPGTRETTTVMVCPDGKIRPVACKKMG